MKNKKQKGILAVFLLCVCFFISGCITRIEKEQKRKDLEYILIDQEHVKIDRLLGHGGLFKTKGVGQQILADAVNAPVSVMSTAGEGGAWGIALLAAYLVDKKDGETLDEFLDNRVFAGNEGSTLDPEPEGVQGFNEFMDRYLKGLPVERAAVESDIW